LNGYSISKCYAVKFDINTLTKSWTILDSWLSPSTAGFGTVYELPNEDLIISGATDTNSMHNLLDNSLIQIMKVNKDGTILNNRYYNYYLPPDIKNVRGMYTLN